MSIEMNARITKASVTLDRGAFLCVWVHVERADGFSQGFGGHILGGVPSAAAGRHSEQKNLAAEWLVSIMQVGEVEDFSKLEGKIIRIRLDKPGLGATIIGIGHPLKDDRWFVPTEALKRLGAEG